MTGIILLFWAVLCHDPKHIPGTTTGPQDQIEMRFDEGDTGNTLPRPPFPFPPPPPPPPPTP